jgi:hypothetical protein
MPNDKRPLWALQRMVDTAEGRTEGARKARVAEALEVSRPLIYDLLAGHRQFSDTMLAKLGFVRETVIKRRRAS